MSRRAYLSDETAAASVEFALVVPVFILLLFGIIQFGRMYSSYIAVTHAAREGARMASVGNFDAGSVERKAYPAVPASVSVSYPQGQAHGNPVEVSVTHLFNLNIPFFGERRLSLVGRATMRQEY